MSRSSSARTRNRNSSGRNGAAKPRSSKNAKNRDAFDGFPIEDLDAMNLKELGLTGELLAASYLEERGYEILEHSYRCSEGEADLIVYDFESNEVVLVEVKSRRARAGEDPRPEEAVDQKKCARYRRIASCYLMDRFPIVSLRFDVVSIVFYSGTEARITHFYSVFDWEAE